MATIHVWSRSSEPKIPYEDKEIHGAHTIANGLAIAQPGDTVLVHGDASPYVENVTVKPGVLLQGRLLPIIDGSGNEARTVTMPINESVGPQLVRRHRRQLHSRQQGGEVGRRDLYRVFGRSDVSARLVCRRQSHLREQLDAWRRRGAARRDGPAQSGDAILVKEDLSPVAYVTPSGDFWPVVSPHSARVKPSE